MKTTTEAQLREMAEAGATAKGIALSLGCHLNQVYSACHILGIKFKKQHRGRERDHARIAAYVTQIAAGMTLSEIAAVRGISRQAVYIALRGAGEPTNARAYLRLKTQQQPQAVAG